MYSRDGPLPVTFCQDSEIVLAPIPRLNIPTSVHPTTSHNTTTTYHGKSSSSPAVRTNLLYFPSPAPPCPLQPLLPPPTPQGQKPKNKSPSASAANAPTCSTPRKTAPPVNSCLHAARASSARRPYQAACSGTTCTTPWVRRPA